MEIDKDFKFVLTSNVSNEDLKNKDASSDLNHIVKAGNTISCISLPLCAGRCYKGGSKFSVGLKTLNRLECVDVGIRLSSCYQSGQWDMQFTFFQTMKVEG